MPVLKSKFRAQINEASLVSEETSSAQYLSELCDTNRGFKRKSANLSRKFLSQNKNVRLLCTLTQTQSYNYITFYWQKYYTIIIQQIRAELSFFKKTKLFYIFERLHVNECEVTAPGEIPWEWFVQFLLTTVNHKVFFSTKRQTNMNQQRNNLTKQNIKIISFW